MRKATCVDCGQPFEVPGAKGPIPQRCPTCRRAFLARIQREKAAGRRALTPPPEVTCRDCGTQLEWTGKGRPALRCSSCLTAWNRAENKRRQDEWRAANAEHVRARGRQNYQRNGDRIRERKRIAHYRQKYGITLAERDQMLADQGGRCLICRTENWGRKGPCVDHCHNTTEVRGLLCSKCNTLIGLANEDPIILAAAIEYLKR